MRQIDVRLMRLRLHIALGLTLLIGFLPAAAQQPLGLSAAGADSLHRTVHRIEQAQTSEAQRWAKQRGLPTRIVQPDGRTIALVGMAQGEPLYLTTFNRTAADFTATDELYPGGALGTALTGDGMRIGLWDEGHPLPNHQEYIGRVTLGDRASPSNHSGHVGGTLVAAGIRPEARGMAYEAALVAYDWDNDASELATEAAGGLLVSNHSYGIIAGWYYGDVEGTGSTWYWFGNTRISDTEDVKFGWYTTESTQYDLVTEAHPYVLPVVAAGNDRSDVGPASGTYRVRDAGGDWTTATVSAQPRPRDGGTDGFDSIAGGAVAKNVLTVGSIGTDDGLERVSVFSSFGPVDDGRVKPEIVGYGEHVFSTLASGPNQYAFFDGTSIATPNVAGSLLLLQQHALNLSGAPLRAASLKGLAIHTAADLGPIGPDYATGFGLLDAAAAAAHLESTLENPLALLEAALPDGGTFTQAATADTRGPLRVTLSWTDPASAPLALTGPPSLDDRTPHLKNDLDLRLVHDATGTVYEPYRLNVAVPSRPAEPGDNIVDPVEQILVPDALAGTYTIRVTHKAELTGGEPQPFTLLVTGAADVVRPVAVARLDAAAEVGRVELRWDTAFERTSGTFVVERVPLDADAFGNPVPTGPPVVLGSVAVRADDATQTYELLDDEVPSGFYRYRIRFTGPERQYVAAETDVLVPVPESFAILSIYPNPVETSATLLLDLPARTTVTMMVYDLIGREVAFVHDAELAAGRHRLPIDAAGWVPGVYIARVTTPAGSGTHQLVVL